MSPSTQPSVASVSAAATQPEPQPPWASPGLTGDAHHQLGFALDRQGKLDEALDEFAEAVRLGPDRVESRVSLGWVLFKKGRLAEAIAEYREALRLDPSIAETHNFS